MESMVRNAPNMRSYLSCLMQWRDSDFTQNVVFKCLAFTGGFANSPIFTLAQTCRSGARVRMRGVQCVHDEAGWKGGVWVLGGFTLMGIAKGPSATRETATCDEESLDSEDASFSPKCIPKECEMERKDQLKCRRAAKVTTAVSKAFHPSRKNG